MTQPIDQAQITQLLQRGDSGAIGLLVRTYHRELLHFAYRFLRNEADAEEVVQEAFLRVHRSAGKFRGDCTPRTWLYRIVANLCLNRKEKSRREVIIDEPPEVPQAADGLSSLLDTERTSALRTALASLPPRQRLMLTMRVYQDLSLAEISEALETPVGTVKATLFQAVANLKKRFPADLFPGESS